MGAVSFQGEDIKCPTMKDNLPTPDSEPSTDVDRRSRWPWLLAAGFALVILIGVFRSPHRNSSPAATTSTNVAKAGGGKTGSALGPARRQVRSPGSDQASTAEEIVAGKLSQFARSRREHVHALGRRHGVEVTADVERFFDAVESGDWDAIEVAFRKINGGDSSAGHSDTRPPGIDSLWPAIIDAYGVAEQVHEWPAQKLLDYGNAVLGSLRPGMVYVGGTDNGRWIPELLNDTSDGEHHVIITQNALADSTYDEAAPLGPLMKLRPQGGQNSLNVERASESVGYWRDTTRQILSDPEASGSPTALKSYSHDAAAAAQPAGRSQLHHRG